MALAVGMTTTSTWVQVGDLGLAFLLSALIGLERELRQKPAGLRTMTLVGFGSALFLQISKYGFFDVVGSQVRLDPSRVAAQIVTGIGFLGAGLIFVRRDAVRGLTTAAVVWLTAAVGMAAGAGLWVLAIVVTAGNFVIVFGFTPLAHRISRRVPGARTLRLTYRDRQGVLRRALAECTGRGFAVRELIASDEEDRRDEDGSRHVSVRLVVVGPGNATELAAALADVDGVLEVEAADVDVESD